MAFDYIESARDAFDALADAGALASLTWETAGTYDPEAGTAPTVATVATTWGAIFEYSSRQVGTQPDSLIRVGDRQLFLAALDLAGGTVPEPPPGARVVGPDGGAYVVVNPKTMAPAGVPVLYELQVRRP